MERTMEILKRALFALVALLPLGSALLSYFGYTIVLFSVPIYSIAIAALSICVVVLDILYKDQLQSVSCHILMALITPMSLINNFLCILKCNHVLVLMGGTVCFVCCCILTIRCAKPMLVKILAVILSALMLLPIGFASLLAVFFPIGQNTVVQTVESPSGKYYAELIDSDQGALGGDTVVMVYENWTINLLLFKIEKQPQEVYWGEWGEFRNMEIRWKDDHCIVINSAEYEIK
ncbi:MAG: hypothetical protein IKU57_02095 [Oscillospiraceae bacterium]|nr:hypothetical protein [Oscillospiraceae bacterium]